MHVQAAACKTTPARLSVQRFDDSSACTALNLGLGLTDKVVEEWPKERKEKGGERGKGWRTEGGGLKGKWRSGIVSD